VIEERAAAYADDPRGSTGLYWRRFHIRGSRENPVIVEEYLMDHKILREILRIKKQMSIATSSPPLKAVRSSCFDRFRGV